MKYCILFLNLLFSLSVFAEMNEGKTVYHFKLEGLKTEQEQMFRDNLTALLDEHFSADHFLAYISEGNIGQRQKSDSGSLLIFTEKSTTDYWENYKNYLKFIRKNLAFNNESRLKIEGIESDDSPIFSVKQVQPSQQLLISIYLNGSLSAESYENVKEEIRGSVKNPAFYTAVRHESFSLFTFRTGLDINIISGAIKKIDYLDVVKVNTETLKIYCNLKKEDSSEGAREAKCDERD